MILEEGNNLIDHLDAGKATSLRLSDELRVAASLNNEIVDVQHFCLVGLLEGATWDVVYTKGMRKNSPMVEGSC